MNVVILGASGMLGSMVLKVLSRDPGLSILATVRDPAHFPTLKRLAPECRVAQLDAEDADPNTLVQILAGADWVVNCIGVIKPYIKDDQSSHVQRALRVNALFPHALASEAGNAGCQVLQIATDCVYSGHQGNYLEDAPHDALDAYGKTKSLGEVAGPAIHHLRCSIIGPELKGHVSLLDWFLGQAEGSEVHGFTNHAWNGITTLHFAKICLGVMKSGMALPHLVHVLPTGTMIKSDLLKAFAISFGRGDVAIRPMVAPTVIDRTLGTVRSELNMALWQAAGYSAPPTVPSMVQELADFGPLS